MAKTSLHQNSDVACGVALPPLRSYDSVMRLSRMGAFFPHRLSFMRVLIRRLAAQKSKMQMPVCALDKNGFGHVVLSLALSGRVYSLMAFSRDIEDSERTDRVIATQWDASFCLFDGVPSLADIDQLAEQVTRQEAGRYDARILTLSRANKSLRLFSHVVDRLAKGQQPDTEALAATGYLMRTTAVYGNGKFGIADRNKVAGYDGLEGAFQAEMLTLFLIREFTLLLAEYCAKQRGGQKAASLSDAHRRYLGVGNSTGLGMAPFLVTHPCLLNSWIMAREVAFARGLAVDAASNAQLQRVTTLLERARLHCYEWEVEDTPQMQNIEILRAELDKLCADISARPLAKKAPFADLNERAKEGSEELQELLVSLIIELVPEEVDMLADCMATDAQPRLIPDMRIGEVKALIDAHYHWVEDIDFDAPDADAQFWYVSAAKLEPRLGLRHEEPGAELEMPFNIAGYIRALKSALATAEEDELVAAFLLRAPEFRNILRRIQTIDKFPYGEIRDNLVGAHCRPIDLLRCKLSFFGASKFDPKSDKWTRITLYQGAPTAADLATAPSHDLDDWLFPLSPCMSS